MSRRTERIGAQLRQEIARILREDVVDPRIRLVTLTRVNVAPDLSNAVVFWSTLGEPDEEGAVETARGLASAAPFVRREVASRLQLRRTPELRFRHDPSLALGDQMLALLREIADES